MVDEFQLKREDLIAVNETTSSVPLRLSLASMSFFRWSFQVQAETSMRQQLSFTGGVVEDEIEEMKVRLSYFNL